MRRRRKKAQLSGSTDEHGLIAIAIAIPLPDHIRRPMRVGLSYLHYIS